MKPATIILCLLTVTSYANPMNDIALSAIKASAFYDNGLDKSPEGQRKTILANAPFDLAVYMESENVPKRIRLAFALDCLREQLQVSMVRQKGSGALVIDEVATAQMRKRVAAQIALLEDRYVEIRLTESEEMNRK